MRKFIEKWHPHKAGVVPSLPPHPPIFLLILVQVWGTIELNSHSEVNLLVLIHQALNTIDHILYSKEASMTIVMIWRRSTRVKVMFRICIMPWRLWWKQTLMDTVNGQHSDELWPFCLLLNRRRRPSSVIIVCLLLTTCRNKQSFSKTKRMQHIIPKEANDTSSTIQRNYP